MPNLVSTHLSFADMFVQPAVCSQLVWIVSYPCHRLTTFWLYLSLLSAKIMHVLVHFENYWVHMLCHYENDPGSMKGKFVKDASLRVGYRGKAPVEGLVYCESLDYFIKTAL